MTEKDLIIELGKLRQIKPSQEWVVFNKKMILGEQEKKTSFLEVFSRSFFQPKLVWATALSAFILVGLFGFSFNSLPGDLLYPIKKIAEKSQAIFVSQDQKSQASLELANKSLEEVTIIAQANQVKRLAPAIQEFQANISQAAKDLTSATSSNLKNFKAIVEQTQKLDENKKKAESLGIVIEESEELNDALAQIVQREINNLENTALTEKQQDALALIKADFEAEDYSKALEKILVLTNQF